MSSAVNLENITDAELHQKRLELGLTNVPITGTTRKLLIRQLENAMSNPGADKNKSRRETIHNTNTTSTKTAEVSSTPPATKKRAPAKLSRRTIAATEISAAKEAVPERIQPPVRKPSTPLKKRETLAPTIQSPVYEEEYGEDIEQDDPVVPVIRSEYSNEAKNEYVIPRSRRSVSLTKSGVVTTSYIRDVVEDQPEVVNEEEPYEEEEEEEEVIVPRPKYIPLSLASSTTAPRRKTYEPLTNPITSSVTASLKTPYEAFTTPTAYTVNKVSLPTYSFNSKPYEPSASPLTPLINENDKPYQSKLMRNLQYRASKSTDSFRHTIVPRGEPQRTIYQTLKNLFLVLDRDYHIKRNFIILLAVVFIIFIYIVFIQ